MSNMVFLMALRRMDVKITAHGFRSAFRDWAAEVTNLPRESLRWPSHMRWRARSRRLIVEAICSLKARAHGSLGRIPIFEGGDDE